MNFSRGKKIVHAVVKFPLQHSITGHSIGVQPGGIGRPLTWANGIIFEKGVFPDTDDIIREKLQDLPQPYQHKADNQAKNGNIS